METISSPEQIEKLRERLEDERGVSIQQADCLCNLALEALASRAEIKRLRDALAYYANTNPAQFDGPWRVNSDDFGKRARAALADAPTTQKE